MPDLRTRLISVLRKVPRGRVARDTVLVLAWQLCRMAALAAWVVLAARSLGVEGYGVFAGVAGLATALAGFSGLGMGYLTYREVALRPECFNGYWPKTMVSYLASGAVLGVCLAFVAFAMFPEVPAASIWLIALSEVLAYPFVSASAYALAAHERLGWSAALPALAGAVRLLALLVFMASGAGGGVGGYLWFHLGSSMIAATVSLMAVRLLLKPDSSLAAIPSWRDLRESLPFSAVWFTGIAMTSLDKALVLRLAGPEVSGLYAAAHRLASLVALPMDSLVMAMTPRMFRRGGLGGSDNGLMRHSVAAILAFGLVAALLVFVIAPFLPWLLGSDYRAAADAVHGIALMIPFYGLRQLGGHVLVTYDRRMTRVAIDAGALVLMALTAVWWVPSHGVAGAVAMIVCAEAFLATLTWCLAVPTIRRAVKRMAVNQRGLR